jgi:hypothetical protein
MFSAMILAAAMVGQSESAILWAGRTSSVVAIDTTKPLQFKGGPITCTLTWDPARDGYGGAFVSPPLDLGLARPVTLELNPRLGELADTWGLIESDGRSVGDWMIGFEAGSTGTNIIGLLRVGPRGPVTLWALQRAGVKNFTITQ